jgi:hypothetical protein
LLGETFAKVSALEVIDLSYSCLRTIDRNVLKVLPEQLKLKLNSNGINEIIPGTMEKISCLEFLHLVNNGIEHLESDIFSGWVNLIYINLARNKLQFLNPDTFIGLLNSSSYFIKTFWVSNTN